MKKASSSKLFSSYAKGRIRCGVQIASALPNKKMEKKMETLKKVVQILPQDNFRN